jgi:hexosaminidase
MSIRYQASLIVLGLFSWCSCPPIGAAEVHEAALGLIPQPAELRLGEGTWTLKPTTRIAARGSAAVEANKVADALAVPLGWRLPVVSDAPRDGDIAMALAVSDTRLGAEGYRLSVSTNGVTIRAAKPAGLFYGGVTFRQLLPAEAFRAQQRGSASATNWSMSTVEIEDQPRFPWRGLLLDPARHFLAPEAIMKFIDGMAAHKLNSLQLHLTDDQGWRLAISKYPRLTQIGAVRKESPLRGDRTQGDGTPYGPFFYTHQQIHDLVIYAEARHVTLVPEIEIPGHFRAALAAYPEFSCTGGPFEVGTRWGVEPDILCPGNDAAVAFAQDVLAEVCRLFPSRFIHIGGDEAPRDRWKQCPKCQARMKAEGLKNEAQLQTWLNHRLEEFLTSKNRRLIGWDEILEGGLTPQAAVMSWRGTDGGLAAAQAGHDVVMSPTTHCYFDYGQSQEAGEPEGIGNLIPLETVYAFDPIPSGLPTAKHRHILGAQGNLWSEYLWTPKDVEYSAFPRATALAEVLWSANRPGGLSDFQRRFQKHAERLDELGVNYRKGNQSAR